MLNDVDGESQVVIRNLIFTRVGDFRLDSPLRKTPL